jgi:AcrR family transcriptional regulator
MTKEAPYHQGNLREALIEAGLQLLAEGGPSALTLRRAAARAGVSHAAPAHHFDGLQGLLTAMAVRAYQDFSAALIAPREAADATAFAQLCGVCRGYLAFAKDNAGLFHLLFVSGDVARDDPTLMQASGLAYQVLREACLPFSNTLQPDPEVEISVWSMVHGYALLGLNLPESPKRMIVDIPAFEVLLERIVENRR